MTQEEIIIRILYLQTKLGIADDGQDLTLKTPGELEDILKDLEDKFKKQEEPINQSLKKKDKQKGQSSGR